MSRIFGWLSDFSWLVNWLIPEKDRTATVFVYDDDIEQQFPRQKKSVRMLRLVVGKNISIEDYQRFSQDGILYMVCMDDAWGSPGDALQLPRRAKFMSQQAWMLVVEKMIAMNPGSELLEITKRWWAEMQQQEKVSPLRDISPSLLFEDAEFCSKFALISMQQQIFEFRDLTTRVGTKYWEFCFSVAFAYTATRSTPDGLSVPVFETFREDVKQFVAKWRPDGVDGFKTLHDVIQNNRSPYPFLLGVWVLGMLAGNRPNQQEARIAHVVGALIEVHVKEWWRMRLASQKKEKLGPKRRELPKRNGDRNGRVRNRNREEINPDELF